MDSNEQLIEDLIKLLENPDEKIASEDSQKLISLDEASLEGSISSVAEHAIQQILERSKPSA